MRVWCACVCVGGGGHSGCALVSLVDADLCGPTLTLAGC